MKMLRKGFKQNTMTKKPKTSGTHPRTLATARYARPKLPEPCSWLEPFTFLIAAF